MARKIEVQVTGDSSSFSRELGKASSSARGFGSKITRALGGAAIAGGAALGGLAGLAVKSAIDFESSFAGIKKTVNGSKQDFDKLAAGMLDLSRTIPVNVNELNRIGEAAGQLGIRKKNILEFTATIAKLGVSTNLAGEEGAAMLARFANITRLRQDKFDNLGSTIVALGNAGASTEAEIAAMALRIGAAGKQIGFTAPQILGLSNALSSVGVEAEAGGTAISTAMITIEKAVRSGGTKLTDFAQVAGMTAQEFAEKWRSDPSGALTAFVEGLDKVRASGGNTFAVLDKLGLGGIRVRDALLRLAGGGDLLRKSLELGERAWKANLALNKEAEQRFKTTASQLTLLKNNIQAVGIVAGSKLLPVFNKALLAVTGFASKLFEAKGFKAKLNIVWSGIQEAGQTLSDRIRKAVSLIDWAAVWSGAKGISEGLAARFEAIDWSSVGSAIGDGISNAVARAAGPSQKLAGAFVSAVRSIDWVSVGRAAGPGLAAALVTAFATLTDPSFWIKNWDLALAVGLVVFGDGIGKLAFPIGKFFGSMLGRAFEAGIIEVSAFVERISPRIATALLNGLERLPGLVMALLGKLVSPITSLFDRLGKIATFAAKVTGLTAVINAVTGFASSVIAKLRELADWIQSKLPTDVKSAARLVGLAIIAGTVGGMAALGIKVAEKFTALGQQIVGWAGSARAFAFKIGSAIVSGILDGIGDLAGKVGRKIAGGIGGAIGWARAHTGSTTEEHSSKMLGVPLGQGIITGFLLSTAELPAKISEKLRTAIEAGRATIEAARSRFAEAFGGLQSDVLSAFDGIAASIQTKSEKALAKLDMKEQLASIKSGISDAQKALADAKLESSALVQGADESPADFAARQADAQQKILAAQQQLHDALLAQTRFNLEQQAAEERKQLDARLALKRRHLEDSLAALQASLIKEGATAGQANVAILKLLRSYGINFKNAGADLGVAFVTGLKETIAAAAAKSGALKGKIGDVAAGINVPHLDTGGRILSSGIAMVHKGETVVPPGGRGSGHTYIFNFPNYVGEKSELIALVKRELYRDQARNGSLGFT